MPTEETYYCNNCEGYKRAWTAEHGRCWECDKYTLSSKEISIALVKAQADYSALRSSYSSLQSSNSSLQQRTYDLQDQISSKERDIEWGRSQLAIKQNALNTAQTQLTTAQNQLTTVRNDLVAKQNQYDTLTQKFTALQIESNNKDQVIESKEAKVQDLEGLLLKSRQEIVKNKLEMKESRLETFIKQIEVKRVRTRDLRNAYQQLIQARENYNQDNIRTADNKIEEIKDELLDSGVSVNNTQDLCRKCEKIAKLRIEQDKLYKEQYQAQIEVPPRS